MCLIASFCRGLQRLVGHPADHRVDVLAGLRGVLDPGDQVAAADVDVVGEPDGDRHRRERLGDLLVEQVDGLDGRGHAAGQHDDLVTGLQDAAGDLTGVPAVVVVVVGLRAYDVLHREAGVDQVAVGGDVDVLEVVHQRRAVVPRRVLRAGHDVVALEGRDRDHHEVGDRQLGRELPELVVDPLVGLLRPLDEVHLVDRQDEVGDPQQRQQHGVPAALLGQALAGVDEHEAEVGGRGAGDHVPGVLDVPRGVGDDELAGRGREVAVGHVDGDALLALGAEPVGQQRQVGVVVAARVAGGLDGLQLVLEDRLGVEQEPPDQGGLPVVDRARRGEAQKIHQK